MTQRSLPKLQRKTDGNGDGTTPPQLMAAAYASCFHTMLNKEILERHLRLPRSPEVDVTTTVQKDVDGGHRVVFTVTVTLSGIDAAQAEDLAAHANKRCPFSKAIDGGNTEVTIEVNVTDEPES